MPTVPIYNGPQVQAQATPTVYLRNQDVSSGARAIAQAAEQLGDTIDRIQLRNAETKANEVDEQLTRDWNDWEDKNRGKFVNQNAAGYKQATDEWWKQAAGAYGKDLDPLAAQMVGKTLMRRQTVALANAGKHETTELEKYADSTAIAAIDTASRNALRSGDYEGEAQRVRDLVDQMGARKQWDADQRKAETANQLGKYHTAVVTQLAEADAAKAQTYLEAAIQRGEIPADRQVRMETVIKGEADNQFASKFAAEKAPLPYADQLAEAAKIEDPKRREKTLMQIKNNHAQIREAKREQESAAADQAWQMVGQGKRVPESLLATMDGHERVQLQEHLRARAERAAAGTAMKTDPKEHARLIDMMLNDPEGFKKERIAAAHLSPTDLEQFAAKQMAMRSNTNSGKQDSMLTDDQRVNAALVSSGINPKKQPDAAYAVRGEIDRRVRAESAARGDKPLNADDKQRIIDSVLVDKVYVSEWGRDSQKPLSLVKPEELGEAYVTVGGKDVKLSTVPMTDRQQIIQALQRRGMPATEQAIVETYLRKNK